MKKNILVLLLSIFMVGCEDDSNDDDTDSNTTFTVYIETFDKFNQEVQIFSQGEDIAIKLSLENKSSNEITITFSTSQQYNFQVKDINGGIVWNWATGKDFDPAVSTLTIPAGKTHSEIISWNQVINVDGDLLEIGDYSLEGYYLTTGIVANIDLDIR